MANPIRTDFYDRLLDLNNQTILQTRSQSLWLGGDAGPNGGEGARAGGFIGKLIQRAIAYDTTEAATLAGSGTLVDNLNHIRYWISTLSGIVASGLSFTDLIDVPSDYEGFEGQVVIVNETGDGLTFTNTIAGGGGSRVENVYKWSVSSGINQLELPDVAEVIYSLSNNGFIVSPLYYELSETKEVILLSGMTIGDTIFTTHYLVGTY